MSWFPEAHAPAAGPVFTDTVVFRSRLVEIGAFRCDREHPQFRDCGPAEHYLFVFPRTSVVIQHEHERPFVTNPAVVTLYNKGQPYSREPISRRGDYCDWFGLQLPVALEVVRAFDPAADARPEHPFRFSHISSDPRTYASQRRLFETVTTGARTQPYVVEEQVVRLLERVLAGAYRASADGDAVTPRQRDAVYRVERLLSARFDEPLSLAAVAADVQMSAYHLCRVFHRTTGRTLGDYRHQLRLRTSLELLRDSAASITDIALALGFCTHSHFTREFRRHFGLTPSAVRAGVALRSTR